MPPLSTNGIQTYYEERGTGPPVIFLHGAFSDHRLWAEQTKPLTDDYRVIVYNLRGHGRTGGSTVESYSMDVYVEDLHALITSLDLDRPTVCGLSMGGMIAQRYAATHPEFITALCTVGAVTSDTLSVTEWLERRVWLKAIEALSNVVGRDRVLPLVTWVNEQKKDQGESGALEGAAQIRQEHAEEFPEMAHAEAKKVRGALISYAGLTTEYSSITVPSLLLYGEHETNTMADHAEYLAATIPQAEVKQIPNAGHNSHVDNPEYIRDSLRTFLGNAYRSN